MAQIITIENDMQSTVNFSTLDVMDFFIYSGNLCKRMNNNNPNYNVIETGETGKLNNTDQVIKPNSIIIKVE